MFQVIGSGGIIETTVDQSDIRGLDTACHGFVVELPQSKVVRPMAVSYRALEGSP